MNHLFVPYEESLELKELGFDESCLAYYDQDKKFYPMGTVIGPDTIYFGTFKPSIQKKASSVLVGTPTFSQAFKWFREKYNIDGLVQIEPLNSKYGYVVYQRKINSFVESKRDFDTYEEAELACLRKLIEIVKVKR